MNLSDSTPFEVHVRRIYNEYLEMPGMRLTGQQAQRLWGLDATTCANALQLLVDDGFLRRTEAGQYLRRSDGSVTTPPLRMAKADLSRPAPRRLAV